MDSIDCSSLDSLLSDSILDDIGISSFSSTPSPPHGSVPPSPSLVPAPPAFLPAVSWNDYLLSSVEFPLETEAEIASPPMSHARRMESLLHRWTAVGGPGSHEFIVDSLFSKTFRQAVFGCPPGALVIVPCFIPILSALTAMVLQSATAVIIVCGRPSTRKIAQQFIKDAMQACSHIEGYSSSLLPRLQFMGADNWRATHPAERLVAAPMDAGEAEIVAALIRRWLRLHVNIAVPKCCVLIPAKVSASDPETLQSLKSTALLSAPDHVLCESLPPTSWQPLCFTLRDSKESEFLESARLQARRFPESSFTKTFASHAALFGSDAMVALSRSPFDVECRPPLSLGLQALQASVASCGRKVILVVPSGRSVSMVRAQLAPIPVFPARNLPEALTTPYSVLITCTQGQLMRLAQELDWEQVESLWISDGAPALRPWPWTLCQAYLLGTLTVHVLGIASSVENSGWPSWMDSYSIPSRESLSHKANEISLK